MILKFLEKYRSICPWMIGWTNGLGHRLNGNFHRIRLTKEQLSVLDIKKHKSHALVLIINRNISYCRNVFLLQPKD